MIPTREEYDKTGSYSEVGNSLRTCISSHNMYSTIDLEFSSIPCTSDEINEHTMHTIDIHLVANCTCELCPLNKSIQAPILTLEHAYVCNLYVCACCFRINQSRLPSLQRLADNLEDFSFKG